MPLHSPQFVDISLLLLRLLVGLVFVTSGYRHLKNPEERSKSIGMSKSFTIFLGIGEVAGGLGVAFGVFIQIAAFVLSSSCWEQFRRKSLPGTPASGEKKIPDGITI